MLNKKYELLTYLLKNNTLSASSYEQAKEVLHISPTAPFATARLTALQLTGTFFFAALFYFIAYNWFIMSHGYKFLLVGLLYSLLTLGCLACAPTSSARSNLLALLGVCLGPMLALFGQTYQTGADPWQLFSWWAVFLLAFSLLNKSNALLWFITWAIASLACNLIVFQVCTYNIFTLFYLNLWVLVNLIIYFLAEFVLFFMARKHNTTYHSLVLTFIFFAVNTIICYLYVSKITARSFSSVPLETLFYFMYAAFLVCAFWFYLTVKPNISALIIILLNVGIVFFSFLANFFIPEHAEILTICFSYFAFLVIILFAIYIVCKKINLYHVSALAQREKEASIEAIKPHVTMQHSNEVSWLQSLQQAGLLNSTAPMANLLPSSIKSIFQLIGPRVGLTFFAWLVALAFIGSVVAFFSRFLQDTTIFFLYVGLVACVPPLFLFKKSSPFFARQWGFIFALLAASSLITYIFLTLLKSTTSLLNITWAFYIAGIVLCVFFLIYNSFFTRFLMALFALFCAIFPFLLYISPLGFREYVAFAPPVFFVCLVLAPSLATLAFITQQRWIQSKYSKYLAPLQYALLFFAIGNGWVLLMKRFIWSAKGLLYFDLAYFCPLLIVLFAHIFAKIRLSQRLVYTCLISLIISLAGLSFFYILPHIFFSRFILAAFAYLTAFFTFLYIGRSLPSFFLYVLSSLFLFIWCVILYYFPIINIGHKALVAFVTGLTFLCSAILFAVAQKFSPANATASYQSKQPMLAGKKFFNKKNLALALVCSLFFAGYIGNIFSKEQHLAQGDTVYIKLIPVDPRSLMQGDYMALNSDIAVATWKQIRPLFKRTMSTLADAQSGEKTSLTTDEKAILNRKQIVASKDTQNVVQYVRLYDGKTALAEDEIILQFALNYTHRNSVIFGTNAFYFQEGLGRLYEQAKYGEFRRSSKGMLILTHMCDAELKRIIPTQKEQEALKQSVQKALNEQLPNLFF